MSSHLRGRRTATTAVTLFIITSLSSAAALAQAPSRAAASDDLFSEVAKLVPEFGGFFLDPKQDALIVNVTSRPDGIAERITQALREVYSPDALDGLPLDNLILNDVLYNWLDLNEWYDRIRKEAATSIEGLVLTDINERSGRITLGLDDPSKSGAQIQAELERLSIPFDAVEVLQANRASVGQREGTPIPLPSPASGKFAFTRKFLISLTAFTLFALITAALIRRWRGGSRYKPLSGRHASISHVTESESYRRG